MAGTVTTTEETFGIIKKITFEWTASAGGAADAITTNYYSGVISAVTIPGTGTPPDDNYDILVKDDAGVDVANSLLLNRDQTNTEWVLTGMGLVVNDKLTLALTGGGNAGTGTLIVYVTPIAVDQSTAVATLISQLSGATGINPFPAAAAAGDNVSLAEVLRYIQESQIGSLANTGGTATLAGIIGDLANTSVLTRFNNLYAAQPRLATVTSTSPLTTGTLFTYAGSIEIMHIIGRVSTVIQNQATTVKLSIVPDAQSAYDICATKDIDTFAAGSLLSITGTAADAMVSTTAQDAIAPGQANSVIASCVTSGIVKVTYGAASTGAIVWQMLWRPLSSGATVT